MNQDKVRCDVCKEEFRATPSHINLICKGCFNKRPPDATGKELIEEFLRDWKWGRVYQIHWKSRKSAIRCRCKKNPSTYWEWFEKKWEDAIEPK